MQAFSLTFLPFLQKIKTALKNKKGLHSFQVNKLVELRALTGRHLFKAAFEELSLGLSPFFVKMRRKGLELEDNRW